MDDYTPTPDDMAWAIADIVIDNSELSGQTTAPVTEIRDELTRWKTLVEIDTLRTAASILEGQGVEPWNRNAVAIRTLRTLADITERASRSHNE